MVYPMDCSGIVGSDLNLVWDDPGVIYRPDRRWLDAGAGVVWNGPGVVQR